MHLFCVIYCCCTSAFPALWKGFGQHHRADAEMENSLCNPNGWVNARQHLPTCCIWFKRVSRAKTQADSTRGWKSLWCWQQHMLNVHPRRWGYDIPLIPLAACTVGQLGKLLMRMIQGWPTVMGKKRYHKTSFLHLFCLCKHLLGDSSIYLHTQTTPLLSSSSFSLGIFRFPDHGCQESSCMDRVIFRESCLIIIKLPTILWLKMLNP